jgi:hypothetical protein
MVTKNLSTKLGLLAGLTVTSSLARAEVPSAAIESYLRGAQSVVAELRQEQPNAEMIATAITAILEDAKAISSAYAAKHTQCAEQIAEMINLYPAIDSWQAQQIRRDIEAATALPSAEGCYPARDIVAHPAIVRAIARQGIQAAQRSRLAHEMAEAIEHAEEIAADLSGE